MAASELLGRCAVAYAGKESPLSEGQKAAVMRASRAPLIVLTGGPGCGKTFATKAIVQLWQSQQKDIRLAAPTGTFCKCG